MLNLQHLLNSNYLFTVNHDQFIEMFATFCGLLNIFLIVRQSNWNFLFGFLNAAAFFFLFQHQKIYADMGLHFCYMAFQLYGYYQWRLGGTKHHGVHVKYADARHFSTALGAIVVLALTLIYILSHYTDSTRIGLDASSSAICLVAQWMMSKKWIQNWWLWLVADVIAITLYLYKGLYFTSGLYAIYILMCLIGLYRWHQTWKLAKAA